eukprot:g36043.t1
MLFCGELTQPCCPDDSCNAVDTVCVSGTCEACGGLNQSCCIDATACFEGRCSPETGTCEVCGGLTQPCCPDNSCNAVDTVCVSGTCEGRLLIVLGLQEITTLHRSWKKPRETQSTTVRVETILLRYWLKFSSLNHQRYLMSNSRVCGGLTQPCCPDNSCNAVDTVCVSGTCEEIEVRDPGRNPEKPRARL